MRPATIRGSFATADNLFSAEDFDLCAFSMILSICSSSKVGARAMLMKGHEETSYELVCSAHRVTSARI